MNGFKNILLNLKFSIIFILILAHGFCAAAQKTTVAVVFSSDIDPYFRCFDGFRDYFDENKIALKAVKYNLEKDNAQTIYTGIKEEKPDLILAVGTKSLQAAQENITDIPIIFSMVLNPGTITGSNVCGVSLDIPAEVKLKTLKKILPNKKNIGLIYSSQSESLYQDINKTCNSLEYRLISKKIDSKTEFSDALYSISTQIDCFLMTPDTDIYYPKLVEYLLKESLKDNFVVIGLSSSYVKAGALLSFDCDYKDIGNQAGELAVRVLQGEKPNAIPIVRPRKVKLSLNLMTAKLLNMELPPEIIEQADELFGK